MQTRLNSRRRPGNWSTHICSLRRAWLLTWLLKIWGMASVWRNEPISSRGVRVIDQFWKIHSISGIWDPFTELQQRTFLNRWRVFHSMIQCRSRPRRMAWNRPDTGISSRKMWLLLRLSLGSKKIITSSETLLKCWDLPRPPTRLKSMLCLRIGRAMSQVEWICRWLGEDFWRY